MPIGFPSGPCARSSLAAVATVAACGTLLALAGCSVRGTRVGEPRVLVEGAAWTWFNDERAIVVGPDLHVGYVDTVGHAGVAVLPPDADRASRSRLSSFRERDDHDNPSLLRLADGRVLAAYAAHHVEPYWYWRSGDPSAASIDWSAEQRTRPLGANITYANLFQLADERGRIYDFFRGQNFDPAYMTSDDGGRSWSAPHHLLLSGDAGTRPYVKYTSDGSGRIDLLYTQAHPRRAETDIYHVYYRDGRLHASDGTPIQRMPADGVAPMPVEAGTRVYDARTAGRAWVWDIELDSAGNPVAVYIAARDSTVGNDLRYRYARWDPDAGRWREREIARAGTRLYEGENHYAGGIALDPADPGTVYASSDVHPVTGDPTSHYELYRGTTSDRGATWTWESLTPGATADNIRPFVPRGAGTRRVVLWLRGRYTTYTDYATDVVWLVDP